MVGSVASSLYGEPRAANDVDVVIQIAPADASRLVRAFPPELFYAPPEEVVLVEIGRAHGGHLNIDSSAIEEACAQTGLAAEWSRAKAGQ